MRDRVQDWLARTGMTGAEASGLLVAAVGAVVSLLVAVRLPVQAAAVDAVVDAPAAQVTLTPGPSPSPTATEVVVHVAGAVRDPGVVVLPAGSRVADALHAAGGATAAAAADALNLARGLVDGERVLVPTVDEVAAGLPADGDPGSVAEATGQLPDGRVDLDTATTDQLEELPGIGPVLAERIVAHREQEGGFGQAAALREVPGIGEATWARLRDLVGVRGEQP